MADAVDDDLPDRKLAFAVVARFVKHRRRHAVAGAGAIAGVARIDEGTGRLEILGDQRDARIGGPRILDRDRDRKSKRLTTVTNAQIDSRLLIDKKKTIR